MLTVGTPAPDFTLPDETGARHSLRDFRGRKVILYFYPKDMTSGCTAQAVGFAALNPQIEAKGAVIIGISKDSEKSHQKFKEKNALPFILLSDPELSAITAYDVWKEKSLYGKKYMGVERTTYLIDENGMIAQALAKVKPKDNPADMLALL